MKDRSYSSTLLMRKPKQKEGMNSDLHKLGRAGGLAVLGHLMPGSLWAPDSNTVRGSVT